MIPSKRTQIDGHLTTLVLATRHPSTRYPLPPSRTFKRTHHSVAAIRYQTINDQGQPGHVDEDQLGTLIDASTLHENPNDQRVLGIPRRLPSGVTAVPYKDNGKGWYTCTIIESNHPSYPVDGYNISVHQDELQAAPALTL